MSFRRGLGPTRRERLMFTLAAIIWVVCAVAWLVSLGHAIATSTQQHEGCKQMSHGRPGRKPKPIDHSPEYEEGYSHGVMAGMAQLEVEADMKFDLGVVVGRTALARELKDLTLIEPTSRMRKRKRK